jgi:hypothetical protein
MLVYLSRAITAYAKKSNTLQTSVNICNSKGCLSLWLHVPCMYFEIRNRRVDCLAALAPSGCREPSIRRPPLPHTVAPQSRWPSSARWARGRLVTSARSGAPEQERQTTDLVNCLPEVPSLTETIRISLDPIRDAEQANSSQLGSHT